VCSDNLVVRSVLSNSKDRSSTFFDSIIMPFKLQRKTKDVLSQLWTTKPFLMQTLIVRKRCTGEPGGVEKDILVKVPTKS
jgi:hypothetical protein